MTVFQPSIILAIFIASFNIPFFLSLILVLKAKFSSQEEEETELPKLWFCFIWWILNLGLFAFGAYRLIDYSNLSTYPAAFFAFLFSLLIQCACLGSICDDKVELDGSTSFTPKKDWKYKGALATFLRKPRVMLTTCAYFFIAFCLCFGLVYNTESAYIEKMLKHESVEDGFVSKYIFVDKIYHLRSNGNSFVTPRYLGEEIVFEIPEDKVNPETNWILRNMYGSGGGFGRRQLLKIRYHVKAESAGPHILANVVHDIRREVVKASVY